VLASLARIPLKMLSSLSQVMLKDINENMKKENRKKV
jgi:hypothetical protein